MINSRSGDRPKTYEPKQKQKARGNNGTQASTIPDALKDDEGNNKHERRSNQNPESVVDRHAMAIDIAKQAFKNVACFCSSFSGHIERRSLITRVSYALPAGPPFAAQTTTRIGAADPGIRPHVYPKHHPFDGAVPSNSKAVRRGRGTTVMPSATNEMPPPGGLQP